MSNREVKLELKGEAVSVELPPLLYRVCDVITAKPVVLPALHRALEELLEFLGSPSGRTNANCWAADMFFALESGCDVEWDELPAGYRMLIDDIGGALHDTVSTPQVAEEFESTPEQLLDRLRAIERDT